MIKTRLVLNFPGFEQTEPEAQLDRIRHGAQKTGELWHFTFDRQNVEREQGANHAISESVSSGDGWETRTRIVQFSWNDIIRAYEAVGHPRGLVVNLPKFLAFFADGTANRYWRASKRYWAFTVFPVLLIAIFAAVAWYASGWIVAFAGVAGGTATIAKLILWVILVLLLCKWPGQRLYLLLTINDWGFARDMVHRSNPVIEERYREFRDTIVREIEASDHEEIVVSGHSFGSVWAIAALAMALEDRPDLLKGREVAFLALGSSLLKIALAPAAGFMREYAARVWSEPELFWHEIQTKDDIIAFYKSDPVKELGVASPGVAMQIDRVNYKKAMKRKRYRKMRTSFYRTHRQYILYQDRRVPFDYIVRLFGPLTSRQLALDPDSIKSIDPAVGVG
jgi:hypothetical protein